MHSSTGHDSRDNSPPTLPFSDSDTPVFVLKDGHDQPKGHLPVSDLYLDEHFCHLHPYLWRGIQIDRSDPIDAWCSLPDLQGPRYRAMGTPWKEMPSMLDCVLTL